MLTSVAHVKTCVECSSLVNRENVIRSGDQVDVTVTSETEVSTNGLTRMHSRTAMRLDLYVVV
jgi:hypothetical protein